MRTDLSSPGVRVGRLREILLGYLQSVDAHAWPGTDALSVEDVFRCYPEAAEAGRVPDREELRRRHPELADAVEAVFGRRPTPG
jgi:hypothetical protein